MRKVGTGNAPQIPVTAKQSEVAAPITQATVTVEDPFKNGKSDAFNLKDKDLNDGLKQLQGDAATIERVLPKQDDKVLIVGTARSRPVPGENGFADYAWGEKLGEELRKVGLSVGTGGGPGAMEAPLRGHARQDALMDIAARKKDPNKNIGWETGEPTRQGANIILPNEQGANKFIPPEHLASFEKFLFRMEFLFRNTSDFVATPGGYGTVAEVFSFMAMKSHGHVGDPIVFGSHDDYFKKFNAAFEPFLNESEKPDLKNVFTDPAKLARFIKKMPDTVAEENVGAFTARMRDDLERGFNKLDGKPPAIAFFGGAGARTQATAGVAAEIAEAMAKGGAELRVGGSPIIDQAVLKAAQSVNPDVEIQAFAMNDAPVSSQKGLDYTKVQDVLVLRELMDSNLKGIVVAPEGAKQIALLFTALCDMQTGEMPKLPVVVIDPDGKFEDVKKMLAETMLAGGRRYINPEDLELFTTVKTSAEAIAVLNRPPSTEAPAAH